MVQIFSAFMISLILSGLMSADTGQRRVLSQMAKKDTQDRFREKRMGSSTRVSDWAESALKEARSMVEEMTAEELNVALNLSVAQTSEILTNEAFLELLKTEIDSLSTKDWDVIAKEIQKLFTDKNLSLVKSLRKATDQKNQADLSAIQSALEKLVEKLKEEEREYWKTYQGAGRNDPKTESMPEVLPPGGAFAQGLRLLKVLSSFTVVELTIEEGDKESYPLIKFFTSKI